MTKNVKTTTQKATNEKAVIYTGELKMIAIKDVVVENNYRTVFPEQELQELVDSVKSNGIIQPILLRVLPKGKYGLVCGGRRFKASQIAQLKEIPAYVRELSNEEVLELQITENLQRSNPHPMYEAQAIRQLLDTKKYNAEEIAARLGKEKPYVYRRLKLMDLIPAFQEMFLADKMQMVHAYMICRLSPEAQESYFNDRCKNWQSNNFRMDHSGNLSWTLNKYSMNLKDAPFNTKAKTLIPGVGACITCPKNTATSASLFPEIDKESRCTDTSCYEAKCAAGMKLKIAAAIAQDADIEFIASDKAEALKMIGAFEQAKGKAVLNEDDYYTLYNTPSEPDRADYTEDEYDSEAEAEQAYKEAVEEYREDLREFNEKLASGEYKRVLYLDGHYVGEIKYVRSRKSGSSSHNTTTVTAAQVKEAIKEGNATPELLDEEIKRLRQREARSKELDFEKYHLNVYDALANHDGTKTATVGFGTHDRTAVRFIVYDSLGYSGSSEFLNIVLGEDHKTPTGEELFSFLENLSDEAFALMVRISMKHKSESKYPNNCASVVIRKMADGIGIDLQAIKADQDALAATREQRMNEKIAAVEKQKEKLSEKEPNSSLMGTAA